MRLNALFSYFRPISRQPVILLGNQKAGTSAIAHLLADYGGLSKSVDIPPLWPPVVQAIQRGELSFPKLVKNNRSWFTSAIIKEPNLSFIATELPAVFPVARYVFIVRDPRENTRSLLDRYKLPGNLADISKDMLPPEAPHQSLLDKAMFDCPEENYVGVIAKRWVSAVQNYKELAKVVPVKVVRYEDFAADKYAFIRELANHLAIDQENDIAASLNREFQPRGMRKNWLDFFGDNNLNRINEVCGPYLSTFHYGTEDNP